MVGSSFKLLETKHKFIFVGSQDYDLTNRSQCVKMILETKPDAIVNLAARVGGVKGNTDFVSDFYFENTMINTNVLRVAHEHNVEKVISFLSTCVYPDQVSFPLTEEQIHNGPPHKSNFGYAYAKRMAHVYSSALRQQFGRNYICAIPNNLYGPCDNFDLENGHVVPAIIRKIYEAKNNSKIPTFWGSGSPLREFTYSEDIAEILLFLLEEYDSAVPINIGNTKEISIRDLVNKISNILEYDGTIVWDSTKPEGQYRKPSSNQRLLDILPDPKYTDLDSGLRKTCDWFLKHYPNVRGLSE